MNNPLDNLIAEVRKAIAAYDRSGDHMKHATGGDCIRCGIASALPRRSDFTRVTPTTEPTIVEAGVMFDGETHRHVGGEDG